MSVLQECRAISTVGTFRALVQCEREKSPSPANRVNRI